MNRDKIYRIIISAILWGWRDFHMRLRCTRFNLIKTLGLQATSFTSKVFVNQNLFKRYVSQTLIQHGTLIY